MPKYNTLYTIKVIEHVLTPTALSNIYYIVFENDISLVYLAGDISFLFRTLKAQVKLILRLYTIIINYGILCIKDCII